MRTKIERETAEKMFVDIEKDNNDARIFQLQPIALRGDK